ncbi:N-6 DNA methylase [Rhizobium leguminosarum]|nr:N-6 DNA methylase [Rhizobium leguminosarum]MBY5863057.1 N-6 DNA methylase [Rhizobium leguminosarum]
MTQYDVSRAAWAHVAVMLVDVVRSGLPANMRRASTWFGLPVDNMDWSAAEEALSPLTCVPKLGDLLPYLLDTYGRTSRLDVIRDNSLAGSREKRKKVGSFYTPQDVADFMVGSIAASPGRPEADTEWWLDPAIGSGVFLIAALRRHLDRADSDGVAFATTRLAGFDISPQACDFAAFAILGKIATTTENPLVVWSAIRANLIAVDATSLDSERGGGSMRAMLPSFAGPMRLICNPPYASADPGGAILADGRPTATLYLPFVEMAWRIASGPRDAACLVVPLALGANRSADHRRCRVGMTTAGGEWTFLFFDRQPHALFGEEAKTRATIAIRRPGQLSSEIRTSRLLKWTSRQRSTIFNEERSVRLNGISIGRLVPKLGSDGEVALYQILQSHRLRVGVRPEPTKASASEIVGSALAPDVFVAGTAYNFLNVFRNYPDQLSWRGTLSASGIHRLPCNSMEEADAILAVLASRMTFWLWHVECDGFHVPAWFLSELPLLNLSLSQCEKTELARLGREIWEGLQKDVICSSNRDRLTFAFRPTFIADLRDAVDAVLIAAIGADVAAGAMLRQFEDQVVSIDGSVRLSRPRIQNGA